MYRSILQPFLLEKYWFNYANHMQNIGTNYNNNYSSDCNPEIEKVSTNFFEHPLLSISFKKILMTHH
jgi:hypothetical protein